MALVARLTARPLAPAIAFALALIVPGCTSFGAEEPPRAGSLLRVATSLAIGSLDPVEASGAAAAIVLPNVMETLVRISDDGDLAPGLAESWMSDGSTFTFTLRKGVSFHDGRALDAAAAKAALDRARGDVAGRATNASALLANVRDVRTDGARTLVVALASPDPGFAARLAVLETAVGSPAAYTREAFRTGLRGDPPVGTGPFRVVAVDSAGARLEHAAGHWGAKARVEAVEVRVETDPLAAIRAGAADVAVGIPTAAARAAEAAGEARLAWRPAPEIGVLRVGATDALAHPDARLGVVAAVDRAAVARALEHANATPMRAGAPSWTAGERADLPAPADPAAAGREALARAGHTRERPLQVTLAYAPSRSPDEDAAARAIASAIEATGHAVVDVQAYDAATLASGVARGIFDLALDRLAVRAPAATAWEAARAEQDAAALWEERRPVAIALNVTGVAGEMDRVLLAGATRP